MKKCKLNEVASLIAGFPFDGHKYSSEGIRVVRGDNVTIGNLRWDIDKRWNYPFKEAQTYSLRNEDIVIGMDGSRVGRNRAIVSESDLPLYLAQRVACVRHNEKSIQKYLYYAIFSDRFEQYIKTIHTGTSIPHISLEQLGDFEFILPSISEQEKIGNLLFDIDQKISLNTRMNAELEAMAKQLYDYWFVQFDFPFDFAQGKPDENGKPYKSSGGKMVWNEKLKREIPEGWEVKTLSNILILEDYRRIPLSNKERENKKGPFPYYGATGIMDYIDEYIFDGDYLLLAEDGSTSDENGNPVVQYIWGKNWVNNHAHIITLNNKNWLEYCYFLLKTIPVVLIETGSIQKKINQENLMSYNVAFPPDKLIESYCDITNTLREKQKQVTDEKNHLTHLRDSLLPMLMNGQVTIE